MPHKDLEARRAYHREYMRKRTASNPEARAKHLARVQLNSDKNKARTREWLDNYLDGHPCVDCGEADPIVLEFDHVRGEKVGNISDMVRRRISLVRIIAEVEKCEVRCANCHRRVTHQRRLVA